MKVCTKCGIEKELAEFSTRKASKDSLSPTCRVCQSDYHKKYHKANQSVICEKARQWAKNNPERVKSNNKSWGEANVDRKRENDRAYYLANKDRLNKQNKLYQETNRDKVSAYKRSWAEANPEKVRKSKRLWHETNIEKVNIRSKEWLKANPAKSVAYNASRRSRKMLAFPQWARTGEYNIAIDAVYSEAIRLGQLTGEKYHVDHIHPLKHPLVCGLHVAANLRPVLATENLKKHNAFTPYVESEL